MLKVTYLEGWSKKVDPKNICPDVRLDPGWTISKMHRFIVHQKEGSEDLELVIGPVLCWYSYQTILEAMGFSDEGFRGEGILVVSGSFNPDQKKMSWDAEFKKASNSFRIFDSALLLGCSRQVIADVLGISVSFWYEDCTHPSTG